MTSSRPRRTHMAHHDYSDGVASGSSPERSQPAMQMHTRRPSRRAVGIVSDAPPTGDVNVDMSVSISGDAHIVINPAGMGVEDGIVALEPNDDFAMGAPPGAPGAFDGGGVGGVDAGATPRAGVVGLPPVDTTTPGTGTTRLVRATPVVLVPATATMVLGGAAHAVQREREAPETTAVPTGPYRDEDVLLSLQLLAYLSKYPHVRQAFYKQRERFHPASVDVPGSSPGKGVKGNKGKSVVMMSARAKEKERAISTSFSSSSSSSSTATVVGLSTATVPTVVAPRRQTNVFSLVERFTFKPSSTETETLPKLPSEIQYWAGVIMRNACRKDDSRGGVRQCANSQSIFFFFFSFLIRG